MSTVTLEAGTFVEVNPNLIKQAEKVLSRAGISYPEFVKNMTEKAIMDFSTPEELPVPCIDDLTDEELIGLFEEGMESIRAGRYYTSEEMMERIKGYGVEF